jgi:hypothetical protein
MQRGRFGQQLRYLFVWYSSWLFSAHKLLDTATAIPQKLAI